MRAYVSIRGTRSQRQISRDAWPSTGNPYPFASLNIGHPDGDVTSFELSMHVYSCNSCRPETSASCVMCDGSGKIKRVFLSLKRPGKEGAVVYDTEVFDDRKGVRR